jgi:hypothetical protein
VKRIFGQGTKGEERRKENIKKGGIKRIPLVQ